jgi:hypothetical protein
LRCTTLGAAPSVVACDATKYSYCVGYANIIHPQARAHGIYQAPHRE